MKLVEAGEAKTNRQLRYGPPLLTGIYFLRWITDLPAEPHPAGTGRTFIP